MPLVAMMPFLVAIVAILAGTYAKVQKENAKTAAALKGATGDLEDELDTAKAERDRLRRRIEALEAIVTSEGYDLEREARKAGIAPALDLDALPDVLSTERNAPRRVRE